MHTLKKSTNMSIKMTLRASTQINNFLCTIFSFDFFCWSFKNLRNVEFLAEKRPWVFLTMSFFGLEFFETVKKKPGIRNTEWIRPTAVGKNLLELWCNSDEASWKAWLSHSELRLAAALTSKRRCLYPEIPQEPITHKDDTYKKD